MEQRKDKDFFQWQVATALLVCLVCLTEKSLTVTNLQKDYEKIWLNLTRADKDDYLDKVGILDSMSSDHFSTDSSTISQFS